MRSCWCVSPAPDSPSDFSTHAGWFGRTALLILYLLDDTGKDKTEGHFLAIVRA